MRRNWNALGGFVSTAQYFAAGEQGGAHQAITDLGYRRYGAKLSTDTEVALSSNHGLVGVPDGSRIAAAFHADLQGKSTFATLGLRFDPAGFQTLAGPMNAGFSGDLALRRHSERFGDVNLDLGHTDDRLDGDVQHDNRLTLSGGRSWSHASVQYVAGLDGTHSSFSSSLQRTGALTFTQSVRSLSLFETFQSSSVSSSAGSAAQHQLALGASKPLLGGVAAYQYARSNSGGGESAGDAVSAVAHVPPLDRPQARRPDHPERADLLEQRHLLAAVRDDRLLVRRLSNVVALQVSGNVFRQTGLGGGSGSGISASLVGPFGFGQPRQTFGRPNPKLPGGHPRHRDLLDLAFALRVHPDRAARLQQRAHHPGRARHAANRRQRRVRVPVRLAGHAHAADRSGDDPAGPDHRPRVPDRAGGRTARRPRSSSASATSPASRGRVVATEAGREEPRARRRRDRGGRDPSGHDDAGRSLLGRAAEPGRAHGRDRRGDDPVDRRVRGGQEEDRDGDGGDVDAAELRRDTRSARSPATSWRRSTAASGSSAG